MSKEQEFIEIHGARENNLKNISIKIPREKLVVITGLSGSGKSSLIFDTLFSEGQRRYMETFSVYARQFMGGMKRPDVDKIDGLSPVISIEQKTTNKNPRSNVGTITEIYDFFRLLYARISTAYSYNTGEEMVSYTNEKIIDIILEKYKDKPIFLLSSIIRSRKGHYQELLEGFIKRGFTKVRIDGEIKDLARGMKLDRYKTHNIELVIDRLRVREEDRKRISDAVALSIKNGNGIMMVYNTEDNSLSYFSKNLMCPTTGISYDMPEPNSFSFNSKKGSCPKCNGLGESLFVDEDLIMPNKELSIKDGGLLPLGTYKEKSWVYNYTDIPYQLDLLSKMFHFSLDTPLKHLPEEVLDAIMNGCNESFEYTSESLGIKKKYYINFEGIKNFILKLYQNEGEKDYIYKFVSEYTRREVCSECGGKRLRKESLHFKIDGKDIAEVSSMDISDLAVWTKGLPDKLSKKDNIISAEILKEINARIDFILDVGLDYMSLNRTASTLSGGEMQRVRLATQIGSQLVGVLYVLDEPSIGLHQRDNNRLIKSLLNLRNIGNSVLIVEHDKDMILNADYVIDIGPKAGKGGGEIIWEGEASKIEDANTLTADYINRKRGLVIPRRREGNGKFLELIGANGNNLKNVSVKFPLGKMILVTGVSGSGKSTLINETLYPILNRHIYNSKKLPLEYKDIKGLENIDKIIEIDQSAIGRTPRSTPATYTGVFTDIRNIFTLVPESQIRGYKTGRFSFNVKGGRCEDCKGGGMKLIEMNFLPDVYVECETCRGKRYNRETLEVKYKGKSISDVLNMTVSEAVEFFKKIPAIYRKIKTLEDVGLGYLTLGQSSTTISGGEAQRMKLATELSKKDTGNTFYILDEPTTGLHFQDVEILVQVLQKLVDKGNTVLVIEHNMDMIKMADHIIDVGPEGGKRGGEIVCEGVPEELLDNKESHTIKFLKKELEMNGCLV